MIGIFPLPSVVWPPNANTSFGATRAGERPSECGGGHCGIDLYLPIGTPVYAVAPGKVYASSSSDSAGEFIWLDHADGWRSHYIHLKEGSRKVSSGQRVTQGQTIGLLGRSGIKNDAGHLHFALSKGGRYIDPVPVLRSWLTGGQGPLLLAAAVLAGWFIWRG